MSLMAKNKPTNRVTFEGGWVELQHLSKGVKNQIQSRLVNLYGDLKDINVEELKGKDEIPEGTNLDFIDKINEIEYYKLSIGIKEWSEKEDITEDTVKELDEDVFKQISEEIDKMNKLSEVEKKN